MWRKQPDADGERAHQRRQTAPSTTTQILVVDDDYQVRQLIRLMLEDAGHEVLVARDGLDAVAVLEAAPDTVALAVIDFNLPGMDGRHLATRINSISPRTRILFVSGQPSETLLDYGLLQDSWFLQKPFTRAELLTRAAERLHP
jgi:two-component system OmpR family response regulator